MMPDNGAASDETGTCPIPVMNPERKTVPVECPWCGDITRIARLEVKRFHRISPVHKICGRCMGFVREGCVSSEDRDRNWLSSFFR